MSDEQDDPNFTIVGDFIIPTEKYLGELEKLSICDPPPPDTPDTVHAGYRRAHVDLPLQAPNLDGDSQEVHVKLRALEARAESRLQEQLHDSYGRLRHMRPDGIREGERIITYSTGVTEAMRQLYARIKMLELYEAYLHTADGQKGLVPNGMKYMLGGKKKLKNKKSRRK